MHLAEYFLSFKHLILIALLIAGYHLSSFLNCCDLVIYQVLSLCQFLDQLFIIGLELFNLGSCVVKFVPTVLQLIMFVIQKLL